MIRMDKTFVTESCRQPRAWLAIQFGKKPVLGLQIRRLGAALHSANAEVFMGEVLSVVNNLPTTPRWVVARVDSVADADYFAAKMVRELGVNRTLEIRRRLPFRVWLTAFRTDRIFRSIEAAITAYQGLKSEAPHGSAEPVTNRAPAYSKW